VSNLRGKGEISVRELARVVDRDVKRVQNDIMILTELGLLKRTAAGGVTCPYSSMHIDMYMQAA
jgi:predicted transcriptional regulator